ncbi:HAD-like protein, partial [Aureobasidium melanogenum]
MQTDKVASQMNHLSVQEQPKKRKPRWSKTKKREQAASKSSLQDQHAAFPPPLALPTDQPRPPHQHPNLVRYVPLDASFPASSYRSPDFHTINSTAQDYPSPIAAPTFTPINRHPSSFFVPSYANYPPPPPPFWIPQPQHSCAPPLAFHSQPHFKPEVSSSLVAASRASARGPAHTTARQSHTQQGDDKFSHSDLSRRLPHDNQDPEVRTPRPSDKRARAIGKLLRPTPSLPYLMNSLVTSPKLDRPKSLLVVLDLNGVLAFRKKKSRAYRPRPNLDTFLDYLFANHHVMIWSSGMPENVERIMGHMLSYERQQKLVAIWSRDKLRLPDHLFSEKVQVYKQLSWIWEDPTLQMNAPLGGWSQRDTVLVDDSIDKAAAEPHNLIEVDEFTNSAAQHENTTLLDVISYLERIRWYDNVSAEIRATPFVASKA